MFLFVISLNLEAQHVFASTGKDISNTSIKISFTIGEPLVSKLNNSTISLSNGFQNATNLIITAIKSFLFAKDELLVYPNPTNSNLYIENKSTKNDLSYKIYSINGNIIFFKDFNNQLQQVDMDAIMSGTYILEIKDNVSLQVQSYKIEKINN